MLLVGGSSRIPLVARMISDALDRPTLVDAHPKYAVALGAATLATELSPDAAAGIRSVNGTAPSRRAAAARKGVAHGAFTAALGTLVRDETNCARPPGPNTARTATAARPAPLSTGADAGAAISPPATRHPAPGGPSGHGRRRRGAPGGRPSP